MKRMCQVLRVRRSGYYTWRKRQSSTREEANQAMLALTQEEYQKSRKTYGSPRVHVAIEPP